VAALEAGMIPADAVLPWAGCPPWACADEYFRFPLYPLDWEKSFLFFLLFPRDHGVGQGVVPGTFVGG